MLIIQLKATNIYCIHCIIPLSNLSKPNSNAKMYGWLIDIKSFATLHPQSFGLALQKKIQCNPDEKDCFCLPLTLWLHSVSIWVLAHNHLFNLHSSFLSALNCVKPPKVTQQKRLGRLCFYGTQIKNPFGNLLLRLCNSIWQATTSQESGNISRQLVTLVAFGQKVAEGWKENMIDNPFSAVVLTYLGNKKERNYKVCKRKGGY